MATRFKNGYEYDKGIWHDVGRDDGKLLVSDEEVKARAALAERYPILFQMERCGGGKRTRVIRTLEDVDDWPKRNRQ